MKREDTIMKETTTLNGINTTQLQETVIAIKDQPSIAAFQFRAKGEWQDGTMSRTTIGDFYGAGQEHHRAEPFEYVIDEAPVLLGNDKGPNPGEFLLQALAGCVTTTFILHASARGIYVKEVSTTVLGNADLRGVLDLDKSVTPAFTEIRLKMNVRSDHPAEEINELIEFATQRSPVFQSLSRPIPVRLERTATAPISR